MACAELAPLNASVAEVRSLVVRGDARGKGWGHVIVDELRRRTRAGRYRTLCAFTHDPRFFVRFGFSIVPHTWLPEKVAADCWNCEHFQKCGQYAVVDTRLGRPVTPSPVQEHLS
jgi:amino-acid N-acetyltransferase